jgi:hypothetical protein
MELCSLQLFLFDNILLLQKGLLILQNTVLAGDIRHPPAQMEASVLAGALCCPPVLCICAGG